MRPYVVFGQLLTVNVPVSVTTTPYETRVHVALTFIETDPPGLKDCEPFVT